jgi:hypothetical protein
MEKPEQSDFYVLSSDTETIGTASNVVSKATAREELLDAYTYWLQN